MKSGTQPTKIDHRDYDFDRTFGSIAPPPFPDYLLTDANLWCPDQDSQEPHFNNPPLPFGCTDYTQADLPADIDGILNNPIDLENITHANANGGADIRQSLLAARSLGLISTFFNIRAYNLDYFDTFRLAQISGIPEKRSISWGSPWFPSWEKAALAGQYLMPMPTDEELQRVKTDPRSVSWHNSKFCGWDIRNGAPILRNKSWQGTRVGENGYVGFSREVVNVVMQIPGTVAFTTTRMNLPKADIKTIDINIIQWFLSHLRQFLGLRY